MSIKAVFKSSLPNIQYLFKNGKSAAFIGGAYYTDVESEIKELQDEVTNRHPIIFIDPAQSQIDSADLDPMSVLKKKFYAEFLAQQAAAVQKDRDMGTTSQTGVLQGIANSTTIAEAMSGSDSGTAESLGMTGTGEAGTGTPAPDSAPTVKTFDLSTLKSKLTGS
jgi:hypothetical protein